MRKDGFSRRFFGLKIVAFCLVLMFFLPTITVGLQKMRLERDANREVIVTGMEGVEDVLGITDNSSPFVFNINVPAYFFDKVSFENDVELQGELTAPNVLYGIKGGAGLTVSGGQNPTISNTGVLSVGGQSGALALSAGSGISISGLTITNSGITSLTAGSGISVSGSTITNDDKGSGQKIFKTITVGSTSVSAGTNTDTLTFEAGTGITVTLDTINKKLAIGGVDPGWTDDGTTIRLTASTDKVGIGTSSPGYKLEVGGDMLVSERIGIGSTNGLYALNVGGTGAMKVGGNLVVGGNTVLGDGASDTITFNGRVANGTSLLPDTDLGSDLGSNSFRFNNIYVANINSNQGMNTAGQAKFTYEPLNTTYTESSVMVNPTSPVANGWILGTGIAGYQRAGIDTEGDMVLGYNGGISAPEDNHPLSVYNHGGTQVAFMDIGGSAYFAGDLQVVGRIYSTFSGGIDPGFGVGSVVFQGASGLAQDNANFYWDNSTKRLGLGTTVPEYTLHVGGTAYVGNLATGSTGLVTNLNADYLDGYSSAAFLYTASNGITAVGNDFRLGGNLTANTSIGTSSFGLSFLGLGNSQSLYVASSGYVGVGTTAPTSPMHVVNNSITSGNLFNLSSTSTALSTGKLLSIDWSPTAATTATGDLFNINIGPSGDVGNLFSVTDNGSSLFLVSETLITSALPHAFTAAGDVSVAYDLVFTNPTISNVKSTSSLTVEAGESFNSSVLTLKTYNNGNLVLDVPGGVGLGQTQAWDLVDSSTISLNIENGMLNFDTTNLRIGMGTTQPLYTLHIGGTGIGLGVGGTAYFGSYVGIGTTAPGYALDVNGIIRGTRMYLSELCDNASCSYSKIYQGGSSSYITLETGSVERVRVNSSGLGIGTTAPLYTLHVGGTGTALIGTRLGVGVTDPNYSLYTSGTFGVGSTAYFGSYVGIGTTAPLYKLEVSGDAMISTRLGIGSTNGLYALNVGGTGGLGVGGTAYFASYVGIGTTAPGAMLDIGGSNAGGTLRLAGNTSGYVQIQPAAAAGSWVLTLPADNGALGEQLTTDGEGVATWASALSSREVKDIIGEIGPADVLSTILDTKVYKYHYKPGMGTGDSQTEYVGIMADEAPWAMHYEGRIINPVNTLGYMLLGVQGVNKKVDSLKLEIAEIKEKLAAVMLKPGVTNLLVDEKVESFATNGESFETGQVVQIASGSANIEKSNVEYSKRVLGVVAENTAGETTKVILGGKTNIRISTVNGAIKKGDFLAASGVPGIAMKATRMGMVVGRALEDFDESKGTSTSDISGDVTLTEEEKIAQIRQMASDLVAGKQEVVTGEVLAIVNPEMALPEATCDLTEALCKSDYFMGEVLGVATEGNSYDGTISKSFVEDLIATNIYTSTLSMTKNAGQTKVLKGQKEVVVENPGITDVSMVQVSFEGDYGPATRYFVKEKTAGKGFTLALDKEVENEVVFSWWVVENKSSNSPLPTAVPTVAPVIEQLLEASPSATPTQVVTPTPIPTVLPVETLVGEVTSSAEVATESAGM